MLVNTQLNIIGVFKMNFKSTVVGIINVILILIIGLSMAGYCYILYMMITEQYANFLSVPFDYKKTIFYGFFIGIFLYAVRNILNISGELSSYKSLTREAVADKDEFAIKIGELRVSHANIYLYSQLSLIVFSISLAMFIDKFGSYPVSDIGLLFFKTPLFLISIISLLLFIGLRVGYYFKNSRLDDALFYAQIEHYKLMAEKERKGKSDINL